MDARSAPLRFAHVGRNPSRARDWTPEDWRLWAYERGRAHRLTGPVRDAMVTFQPFAPTDRQRQKAGSYTRTAVAVIDGLVAAQVLRSQEPDDLYGIVMLPGINHGNVGLEVRVSSAHLAE